MKRFSNYHRFAQALSNGSCNLLQKFQKVQLYNACISKQQFIHFHSLVELQCDIPKYIPYLRWGSLKFYDKMLQMNLLNLWPWLPSTIADGIQVEAPQYDPTAVTLLKN